MYEIEHYRTVQDRDVFQDWYVRLKDKQARRQIDRRLYRVRLGNFGDHRSCGDGVWELRIDLGPGYRVYYAISGNQVVLLLCGGDKRGQSSDIERAIDCLKDFKERTRSK